MRSFYALFYALSIQTLSLLKPANANPGAV